MAEDPLFLTTLGREFSEVVADAGFEACAQDAYEVFSNGLSSSITYDTLASISKSDIEAIRAACDVFFEGEGITADHIKRAIDKTLRHWT
jgi:hypothetical protein